MRIEGEGTLLRRPMGMMVPPLQQLGVRVKEHGGHLPFEVCGPMHGGEVTVDGSVSSQFVTGLLLALPRAAGDTTLHVRDAVSTPYLDMTLDTAARFGVEIFQRDYEEFYIPGAQHYCATELHIEGDWSAAAMLLVAGATAGEVTVANVPMLSKQADTAVCTALGRAGAAGITPAPAGTPGGPPPRGRAGKRVRLGGAEPPRPPQGRARLLAVEVVARHAVLEHVGEPGVFAGERTAFDVSDAGDCLVDGGAGERGVYADECIFENLHAEGLCEVPHDIGAVEIFVTEQVSEDFEDGVFEIGFCEGHKFTFFIKLRENRES